MDFFFLFLKHDGVAQVAQFVRIFVQIEQKPVVARSADILPAAAGDDTSPGAVDRMPVVLARYLL